MAHPTKKCIILNYGDESRIYAFCPVQDQDENKEIISRMIDHLKEGEIDSFNGTGMNSFLWAAFIGDVYTLKLLRSKGARINVVDQRSEGCAMHCAFTSIL